MGRIGQASQDRAQGVSDAVPPGRAGAPADRSGAGERPGLAPDGGAVGTRLADLVLAIPGRDAGASGAGRAGPQSPGSGPRWTRAVALVLVGLLGAGALVLPHLHLSGHTTRVGDGFLATTWIGGGALTFLVLLLLRRLFAERDRLQAAVAEKTSALAVSEERFRALVEDSMGGVVASLLDVTESRRALEAVRVRDSAIATSVSAIALADLEGRLTYVNAAFLDLWGYPCAEAVLGQPATAFWRHPAHAEAVIEALQGQSAWRGELVALRQDGRLVEVELAASLVRGEDGRPVCMMGSFVDVSARKRAEEALRRANRALRSRSECGHAMARASEEAALLDDVCRVLVEVGGYRLAWVGMARDDPERRVEPVARAGADEGYVDQLALSWADCDRGRGPTGRAIRDGRVVVARDLTGEASFGPWREAALARGFGSSIALPLVSGERVCGALNLYAPDPDAFDPQEVELLGELAADLAFGLEALRTRKARERSDALIRAIAEQSDEGISVATLDGDLVLVNRRFAEMTGYREEDLLRMNVRDLLPEADEPELLYRVAGGGSGLREVLLRRRDGALFPAELSGSPLQLGPERLALGMVRDISERRAAEAGLHKLSSAVEQAADPIVITDRTGVIEYVNPAFERLTGYSGAQAVGRTFKLLQSGLHPAEFYAALWERLDRGEVFQDVFINRRNGGALFFEEKTITPIRDSLGRITHFVSTGKDITERIQAQERLQYLAHHDVLTGLPNRSLFMERLQQAVSRGPEHTGALAVLFLDLDRFKLVNDSLGHQAGDEVLRTASARLLGCVRPGDTVARLGGDEFTLLLADLGSADGVAVVLQRIEAALAPPVRALDHELYVTASIGVSIFPEDGTDPQTLVRNADTAMYRAKEQGRNRYAFYSADLSTRAVERLTLENDLRRALQRGELSLVYQPQVELANGRVAGVEALVRWEHPVLGTVSPARFIPVAEESGLIGAIDTWVLAEACRQLRAWRDAGAGSLGVAVNLSGITFTDAALADRLARVLAENRLEPLDLEVEITESTLMQTTRETERVLEALAALGVRVAVDDFGTGYSSLAYLKRFAIDTLKVDRGFVRDVATGGDDAAIVRAVIALAHSLGLRVVAEGVEEPEQLDFLRVQGCDGVQGYLLGRPVPASGVAERLGLGV
jgi:diguanylate cyclase (GGDEF)-like protein/PAS domain S-box-containing protein